MNRVLIYVQHLLGVGHLHRTAAIARALVRDGFETMLVSGGYPDTTLDRLDGIQFRQLPPARAADASFRIILDAHGNQVDEAWWQSRRAALFALSDGFKPDAVLTELFPFARRPMRHELLPWLAHLHEMQPRPLIYSSVRDILVDRPKPQRDLDALNWLRSYYDGAFVHGDPTLIPFERTFPLATTVQDLLIYTGYIVEHAPARATSDGRDEVLVSAGGGAVGLPLFHAAIAARPLSQAKDATWRLLVSPMEAPDAVAELKARSPAGVIVDQARPDFPAMLQHCRLSISKAGYNTVMETLHARARAVIVPFAGGDETEQALRAELLAARGAMAYLRESELTPQSLAAAIDRALAAPKPQDSHVDLDGAAHTARLLREKLALRKNPIAR
ncbi:glycosyltransferase [Ferrovibrio sp.]|uniref:glycosyltransferase family protein n=1 Tax=Ferrovibrio sp. TaxID=1917215 RepID=UPI0025BC88D4|nr:glycosyltransferase [Ferrovibrio sp.]MBX3454162.1 glycosyl transferase [Ferrovibrio sp.]